jgi:hypothetical protein
MEIYNAVHIVTFKVWGQTEMTMDRIEILVWMQTVMNFAQLRMLHISNSKKVLNHHQQRSENNMCL